MSEEAQREGVADFHVVKGKRSGPSRRLGFFLVLILAVVWFIYKTDLNKINTHFWNRHAAKSRISATEPTTAGQSGINISSPLSLQMTQNTTMAPILVPNASLEACLVQYPHEYHFTINEPHICEEQKPFVVLIVPVKPSNSLHRDNVRQTWGGETLILGKALKLFFMVGRHIGDQAEAVQAQLLNESGWHRDVIQSDFLDCYKNLTIKTMVMLEWLDSYCSSASYAMKVDSDVFLNGHNLVNMLLNAPRKNYMTGFVEKHATVQRDPTAKWYVPVDLYPDPYYVPYALGLGYILSLDLPEKLVEASKHIKAFYLEDVYLGLCMNYSGIPFTDPPNGGDFNWYPVTYNRCAYSRLIVTTTEENADCLAIWKDFQRPGSYC